jgi:hypothetical protein
MNSTEKHNEDPPHPDARRCPADRRSGRSRSRASQLERHHRYRRRWRQPDVVAASGWRPPDEHPDRARKGPYLCACKKTQQGGRGCREQRSPGGAAHAGTAAGRGRNDRGRWRMSGRCRRVGRQIERGRHRCDGPALPASAPAGNCRPRRAVPAGARIPLTDRTGPSASRRPFPAPCPAVAASAAEPWRGLRP